MICHRSSQAPPTSRAGDGVTYTGGDGARGPRAGPVIEPPMPAGGSRASRPLTREDCWEHIYDGPVEEV